MRHGWHRSPCTRTAMHGLETNRTRSRDIDAAALGRRSPRVDVEARVERAPDKPQTGPERPAPARRPLRDFGIFELLGHGADQRTHTSQPKAKNTRRSNLPVAGHDLCPARSLRGRARWLEARGMRKPRPRHAKALPTARTHVWDITLVVGFDRGACT